jgi:hypothetical protein
MIAMALACKPRLLIADEPTTALDVSLRLQILDLLKELQEESKDDGGMAILLITHDLNLVKHFAQRVAVLNQGNLMESGPTKRVFEHPEDAYTRALVNSEPVRDLAPLMPLAPVLLKTEELSVAYPSSESVSWFKKAPSHKVLKKVSFALKQGQTIGVRHTRGLSAGSRLTAYELVHEGYPATLVCDSAAASLMASGRVDAVVVGADRVAANGDTANKIGTYGLAILAAAHGVPFYVAAPSSTFDLSLATGDEIPIEERAAAEVTRPLGVIAAPEAALAFNPAFDVTPARLIRGIVTEHGVVEPVTPERIRDILGR